MINWLASTSFYDQFLHSETNAKVFFYFSVWIYKMIILHWKGDNYACFNYKTFLHHVSPFVLCKEKVFGPILLMNECCFYEWCLCEIDCVFSIFFFLCEVEARLRTPSMIYSRFLWLLLLLFWAFLAPMQSGYLYKAPSFCIYKKTKTLKALYQHIS